MTDNNDLIQRIGEVVDQKLAARFDPIEKRLGVLEKGQEGMVKGGNMSIHFVH